MNEEHKHKSILIIFINWAHQPRIRIVQRTYAARNSPSPNAIKDIDHINPSLIAQFPDDLDKKLLGWLMVPHKALLPDPVRVNDIPVGIINEYIKRKRAYYSPSGKNKSLKRIYSVDIDIPNVGVYSWSINERNLILSSSFIGDDMVIIEKHPIMIISRTENNNYVGIPYARVKHNDGYVPLFSFSKEATLTLLSQLIKCARSEDYLLWYFPDNMYELSLSIETLINDGWDIEYDDKKRVVKTTRWNMKANDKTDWFEIDGVAQYNDSTLSISEMLAALRKRSAFVALESGGIAVLPSDWIKNIIPMEPYLSANMRISRSFVGLISASTSINSENSISYKIARKLISAQNNYEPVLWDGKCLKPYQNCAVNWLNEAYKQNIGCLLADEMGLGKTIVTLAHLSLFKGDHLIVAPASIISNWIHEIEVNLPNAMWSLWGSKEEQSDSSRTSIYLMSYQTMLRNIDAITMKRYMVAVFDESQYLKNSFSMTANAARKVKCNQAIALTGTPIENNVSELWSHLNLVAPNWHNNRRNFETICSEATKSDASLIHLRKALSPFILRRTRSDVLKDLPDLNIEIIRCELSEDHLKLYKKWMISARKAFSDPEHRTRKKGAVLEVLLRLRQICCDPLLITQDYDGDVVVSGKTEAILNAIIVISEYDKLLVFSQFSSYLELLKTLLDKHFVNNLLLIGTTGNRDDVIKEFKESENTNVLLASLKVGGVGLNLIEAANVVLCDPWWNPAAEMQAWSRAYRMGQKKNVNVIKFVCKNTIEERILELQEKKATLNQFVPEKISSKEIIELLK